MIKISRQMTAVCLLLCACLCHPVALARNVAREQVVIRGIDNESREKIYHFLGLTETIKIPFETIWQEKITEAVQAMGFLNATIAIEETPAKITIQINTGLPTSVDQLQISVQGPGKLDSEIQQALREIPLKKGNRLQMSDYQQTKKILLAAAERSGYLTAELNEHKIVIDKSQLKASLKLVLQTGPRFYFGAVTFQQAIAQVNPSSHTTEQKRLPLTDEFLHRFLTFKPGEPYSYEKIVQLQDTLSGSNYFRQVAIRTNPLETKNVYVPVAVSLTPRPKKLYNIGAGFGTDTGARISAGLEQRYLNSFGHYITALFSASQNQNTFLARYIIPGKNPLLSRYEISGGSQTIHFPQGNNTTEQLGLNHISKQKYGQQTIGLQYQHQQSPGERMISNYLLPSISLQFSNQDVFSLENKGYRLLLSLRGASRGLLSSSNFVQTEIHGKYVIPILKQSRIIMRGDIGYSTGNSLDDLPLPLRFYTGSSQSVRGFGYLSLGPGRYLTVGSAEVQPHLHGKLYGILFYDTGNAGNVFPLHLERSAGTGLMWLSPVGPVSVTLASALSLPSRPKRLQFNIGLE